MKKLIFLTLLLAHSAFSQSAYYRLGYGDIFPATDAFANSLGQGVIALEDSTRMIVRNPASLTSSKRVHFGVTLGSVFRSMDGNTANNTRLEQLFVSFPIGNRIGLSLGTHAIADFASEYATTLPDGAFSEHSEGGIWEYNIGLGYDVSSTVKLGVKLHIFQGLLRREANLQLDGSQEIYVVKGNISGRSFEAGAISNLNEKVSLGLTINVPYDTPVLSGRDSLAGTESYVEIEEVMDAWPTTIKLGVVYHQSKMMNVVAGISQQLFASSGFDQARVFGLPPGWSTVPVASFQVAVQRLASDRTSRYMTKRMGWQTGVSIKNYYLFRDSKHMIYEYSLLSGANLELRNGRSLFEISGEFGSRGGEPSLPDELFARIKLGIQINDTWFRKVKRR